MAQRMKFGQRPSRGRGKPWGCPGRTVSGREESRYIGPAAAVSERLQWGKRGE